MNTDGTGFYTCKECHQTESLWNHVTTDHKEGEQLEDRRNVGESICNSGDGTDQRIQSLMMMMMMMMMMVAPQCSHRCLYYIVEFHIHGSVYRRWLSRNTNKMQLCNRIYYSKVYWRLKMFRAAYRSSSGALNWICSLWFTYPCGDRPLSSPTQPWQRPVTTCVYKPEAKNTV